MSPSAAAADLIIAAAATPAAAARANSCREPAIVPHRVDGGVALGLGSTPQWSSRPRAVVWKTGGKGGGEVAAGGAGDTPRDLNRSPCDDAPTPPYPTAALNWSPLSATSHRGAAFLSSPKATTDTGVDVGGGGGGEGTHGRRTPAAPAPPKAARPGATGRRVPCRAGSSDDTKGTAPQAAAAATPYTQCLRTAAPGRRQADGVCGGLRG